MRMMKTSVIVLVVDDLSVAALEPKRDTPVATDRDRPRSFAATRKLMKAKTGQIHILDE